MPDSASSHQTAGLSIVENWWTNLQPGDKDQALNSSATVAPIPATPSRRQQHRTTPNSEDGPTSDGDDQDRQNYGDQR
jgi:hypothetical protein